MPGYDGYNPYTSYGGYTGTTGTTKPGTSGGYQHPGGSGSGSGSGGNDNRGIISVVDEIPGQVLTEEDKIWELATQAAASNPGYAKSFEGQELMKMGINPGDDAWIQHFGLPQIIATGTYGSGAYTGDFDDNWASAIKTTGTGDFIYSGQGKHLMDQYDDPTGTYQEQVDDYYAMRDAQQAQQTGGDQGYGYGYDPGSGGGGGYSVAGVHPRSFYKGLQYQDFSGKEVQKMLHFGQKIDAANVLSGLSQGAQAFAMDPKARGIMAVLTA
tara:strand:+ start:434 stop:1240 length:807 start_codon:yes stop_codon:yes gene_type:complete